MLWFGKRTASSAVATVPAEVVPVDLPVPLDTEIFQRHFNALLAGMEQDGGADSFLAALEAKRQAVAEARERALEVPPGLDAIEPVLALVFTARRKLYPALTALGDEQLAALMSRLWFDTSSLPDRLQQFIDAMPGAENGTRASVKVAAKLRRAAWDFAAEMLHYGEPERYPLMSRWVWDQGTQSGALREFVRGGDAMREVPFSNDPAVFEGARRWLAGQLAAQGIYRDEALWINLVLGQAYLAYFRSMTEGSLGADFGRGVPPNEQLKRLLGIDAAPGARPDRVKKPQAEKPATQSKAH
ncbi:MAG: hypothetical protein OEV67_02265 [Betaproteobacteria bacterium]|nr:hypothetical protein [Betaproteobacteria bacterium]MDH4293309.1 hypothetical protein [Betaproteobacteria bacterium]